MTRKDLIKKHRVGITQLTQTARLVGPEHERDEIDELEYQMVGLKKLPKVVDDLKGWQESVEDRLLALDKRLDQPPPLMDYLKARIRVWLDVDPKSD